MLLQIWHDIYQNEELVTNTKIDSNFVYPA